METDLKIIKELAIKYGHHTKLWEIIQRIEDKENEKKYKLNEFKDEDIDRLYKIIINEMAWNIIILSYGFLLYFISVITYDNVIPLWLGAVMLYIIVMPLIRTNKVWTKTKVLKENERGR